MSAKRFAPDWLDNELQLPLRELAELSGLSEVEIHELTECGVLMPADPDARAPVYDAHCVVLARTASRLRSDFELDATGLALALTLLGQVRQLENRIRELEARLPGNPGSW
ncbi:MAG TPA: chaperone modulator CbpM [Gammaproteobacteria bacterium]|nr:chaperone modulator CbpM [Gammaproteobacteria bacterium]